MTNEQILEFAKKARLGANLSHSGNDSRVYIEGADWHDELKTFAELVTKHEREEIAKDTEWCIENYLEQHIPERIRAREKQ